MASIATYVCAAQLPQAAFYYFRLAHAIRPPDGRCCVILHCVQNHATEFFRP